MQCALGLFKIVFVVKGCLHIPTPSPSQCLSKFNIVVMVMGILTGRIDWPILPVIHWHSVKPSIDTVLNFWRALRQRLSRNV